MLRRFVSTFLSIVLIVTMIPIGVMAGVQKSCTVKICDMAISSGTNLYTHYFRVSSDDNGLHINMKGENQDWNVGFYYDEKTEERKLVLKDLDLTYNSNLIYVDELGFDDNLVIEFQGKNTLTSNTLATYTKYFIFSNKSITITGTDGSSLDLIKSPTGKTYGIYSSVGDINIDNLDINMDLSPLSVGIEAAYKINIFNSNIKMDIPSIDNARAAIFTQNDLLTVNKSQIEINLGSEDVTNKNPLIGIWAKNHDYADSVIDIYINNFNGTDCYGITKNIYSYGFGQDNGAIKSKDTEFKVEIFGDGIGKKLVGIGGNSLDIEGGQINLKIRGNYDYIFGLTSWGWTSWTDHKIFADNGKASLKNVYIDVDCNNHVEETGHIISLQNDAYISGSKLISDSESFSDVGIYIGGNLVEEGRNLFSIKVCDHDIYPIYFDNCKDDDVIEFNKYDKFEISSFDVAIYSNANISTIFGEHNDVHLKEDKTIVNDRVTYSFVDSYTGSIESYVEEDGWYKVTLANPHIYSNCVDTECDYEGCGEWHYDADLSHKIPEGKAICSECNYVSEISIYGIDQPVATKLLDTAADINVTEACVLSNVSWSNGSASATTADYETAYTASVSVTTNEGYWTDDNTKVTINGKEVTPDSNGVVSISFNKTENKPTPVPTEEIIPTSTPTTSPTTSPVVTPTSVPTATPTAAPTSVPTVGPIPTTAPTAEPELNVGAFIDRCYDVALGREADEGGYNYWVDNLNNGQACGAQVGYGFIFSQEYMNKNRSNEEFVTDLYSMYFDRKPDTDGFNYWLDKLNSGSDRETVFAGFANSLEFYNLCTKYGVTQGVYLEGVDNTQQGGINCFVARLYKVCFNRLPDMGGQGGWVLKLYNGEVSGTSAAYGFVFSPEFIGKEPTNEEFVNYMYSAFFGREADEGGFTAWVETLNNGGSYEDVFNGFTGSAEFFNLCASYGINP